MRGRRLSSSSGFTLIELMVVMVIIALATGLMTLALRDSAESQLEKEGVRLCALLESARAQARISGATATFELVAPPGTGFRFNGLPAGAAASLPHAFLDEDTQAVIVGAPFVPLGPEPLIGSQRILLKLNEKELTIGTDGLSPFTIIPPEGAEPVPEGTS
jgi:general secretion pathway protein H